MSDLVARFQQLLADTRSGENADTVSLVINLLAPTTAEVLKLCTIPDQFNAELICVLVPALGVEDSARLIEEFSTLSIVTPSEEHWAVHDKVRQQIFRSWLQPERRAEFTTASVRLAAHFARLAETSTGAQRETARRRHMFHLFGADADAGFAEFERLERKARHELRFAECAALIRLIYQYDPVLTREQRLWLAYHDGKLAIDQRNWERAELLLGQIIATDGVAPKLGAVARVRLGLVYGERREWTRAVMVLEQALGMARSNEDCAEILPRILRELGNAYRETARLDLAYLHLQESISVAESQQAWASLGNAYNSVGTLHLKQREAREAIQAFEQSLANLDKARDVFRSGQVLNNLGIAYAELGEWQDSERYYERSLDVRKRAGDSSGQATVLNNLAHVRANQGDLAEAIATTREAVAIFETMRDPHNAVQAQVNLGRYMWRAGKRAEARQALTEAASTYSRLGRENDAAHVQQDLASLDEKKGLPWWAWLAVVVAFAIIVLSVASST